MVARRAMARDTGKSVVKGGSATESKAGSSGFGAKVADLFAIGKSGIIIAGVCTAVCGFAYTA